MPECKLMNECLEVIAKDYAIVKICRINSGEINLSEKFVRIFLFSNFGHLVFYSVELSKIFHLKMELIILI